MKKKEFLAGTVLLAASSALCLRLMKKVGERLKKQRMGQKNSINITYLLSPDTIDVEMRETVKDKSLITGVVNRGQSENELLARKFLQKHLK